MMEASTKRIGDDRHQDLGPGSQALGRKRIERIPSTLV